MQESYNLGWNIGAVVDGTAKRNILLTDRSERRRIAQAFTLLPSIVVSLAFSAGGRPDMQLMRRVSPWPSSRMLLKRATCLRLDWQ